MRLFVFIRPFADIKCSFVRERCAPTYSHGLLVGMGISRRAKEIVRGLAHSCWDIAPQHLPSASVIKSVFGASVELPL